MWQTTEAQQRGWDEIPCAGRLAAIAAKNRAAQQLEHLGLKD
jgi:hypothetical protein